MEKLTNVTAKELTYSSVLDFMRTTIKDKIERLFSPTAYDADINLTFTTLTITLYHKYSPKQFRILNNYNIDDGTLTEGFIDTILNSLLMEVAGDRKTNFIAFVGESIPFAHVVIHIKPNIHINIQANGYDFHKYMPIYEFVNMCSLREVVVATTQEFNLAYNRSLVESSMDKHLFHW